jgi:hypothetical protein
VKACPHLRTLVPFMPGMGYATAELLLTHLPNFDLKSREPVKKFMYALQNETAADQTHFDWTKAVEEREYRAAPFVPKVFQNWAPFLRFPQWEKVFENMRVNNDPLIKDLLECFFPPHAANLDKYWGSETHVLGHDGTQWGKTETGTFWAKRGIEFIRSMLEGGNYFSAAQKLVSGAQMIMCEEENRVDVSGHSGNLTQAEIDEKFRLAEKRTQDAKIAAITDAIKQYRLVVEPMIRNGNGYDDKDYRNTTSVWDPKRDDVFGESLLGQVISGWVEWREVQAAAGDQSGAAAGATEGELILVPAQLQDNAGMLGGKKYIKIDASKCKGRSYEQYKHMAVAC